MTACPEELWAHTFRYVAERSPYYREVLANTSKSPVPGLGTIRPIDKRLLSERNLDFLCVPHERIVEIVTTSGTTGNPLVWMLTETDLERLGENERMSFDCAGLSRADTVLLAVGMERGFMAGLAYWLGLRKLGCGIIRAGAGSAALVLDMIHKTQPTAVVGVPSFLRVIAEKARATGLDLGKSSVEKAICIGEPIREKTFGLNAVGRLIENAWGAKVLSTYGVTEFANSLCECAAGRGGHLHEDQLHLEILDEQGRPVPDGEIGEVVGTTFGVEGMPLIRYRTGDCAGLFREPCVCGRTSARIGPIIGRKNQKLKFRGASVFPSTLQMVLEEAEGVENFVIVARSNSDLSDSIEVLIHGGAAVSTVRDLLQARSKVAPEVRQVSVDELEALQLPPQARKRRTFVDLR
jgi:phenylacetate-CoA ligase